MCHMTDFPIASRYLLPVGKLHVMSDITEFYSGEHEWCKDQKKVVSPALITFFNNQRWLISTDSIDLAWLVRGASVIEDCLYSIKLKKNAVALEDGKTSSRKGTATQVLQLDLKAFIQNMATYRSIKQCPVDGVQNGGQRSSEHFINLARLDWGNAGV